MTIRVTFDNEDEYRRMVAVRQMGHLSGLDMLGDVELILGPNVRLRLGQDQAQVWAFEGVIIGGYPLPKPAVKPDETG